MQVGYKTESDLIKEEKVAVLEDKSNNSTKYVVWLMKECSSNCPNLSSKTKV
jgi:hypothetical protein